ncbi:MAG: ABC transporter permease [Clostridiales bacterium]|nr:ABC transporter permease [Clostridiales bacterium]
MSRGYYRKLAVSGLKKNGRVFLPYVLACVGNIAIFQVFLAIAFNPGISTLFGSSEVSAILSAGSVIVGIFSVIFLFYTNSFLIKQRKRELALYNILGMGKFHIARMLLWESLIVSVSCLILGVGAGALLTRLMFLLLLKIIGIPSTLEFAFPMNAVKITVILFAAIFLVNLLNNFCQIHLASPMELLQGAKAGEKEPKTRWILALAGLILTGGGYWLAIISENPMAAISALIVAVILVMAGTYALFIAGSVAVLKLMKKHTGFYYKKKHFISVSGLVYRMKQNAAGLASICIMSTAVLLVVSTTVSLYFGTENAVKTRYPHDISMVFQGYPGQEREEIMNTVHQVLEEEGLSLKKEHNYVGFQQSGAMTGNTLKTSMGPTISMDERMCEFFFLTAQEYEQLTGKHMELTEDSAGLYVFRGQEMEEVTVFGRKFSVEEIKEFPNFGIDWAMMIEKYYMVVKDRQVLDELLEAGSRETSGRQFGYQYLVELDMGGEEEQKMEAAERLNEMFQTQFVEEEFHFAYLESRQLNREGILVFNGSFFFLGILLGAVFLIGTVLIIYYKQISEGYEDKKRFEIMEKVGMSQKEIRQAIRSQILKVFFLPLVMAVCHIGAAFPLMTRILAMVNLSNRKLFFLCTCGTILVFAAIYGVVYGLTAKVYYRIVK